MNRTTPKKIKIGLQLGIGGLGDFSFNDSAYQGLKSVAEIHPIEFETASWLNISENTATLSAWAEQDFDLIIVVGYDNAQSLQEVAPRYPNQRFASVDYAVQGDNIWSATYREYEGDYVVGVMAGLVTRNQMVGFIGGGITPIIKRIEAAFAQGLKSVGTSIAVISDYVGEFDNPATGRILAETQYTLGVDIIYQVAGRCGLGAIETAKERGKLVISTGGDHSGLAPSAVLTSRIKDVSLPVYEIIEATINGKFVGGIEESYGFAEGGIKMAPIRSEMQELITPSIQKIMLDIQADVVSGKIKVELD